MTASIDWVQLRQKPSSQFLRFGENFTGRYRGATLLDIGTGPVVYTVITASQWFDEVFLSDISKDNVAFLRKWLAKDSETTEAMRYQMGDLLEKKAKGELSWYGCQPLCTLEFNNAMTMRSHGNKTLVQRTSSSSSSSSSPSSSASSLSSSSSSI